MTTVDIITDIVSAGALAPSGDNSQPWSFRANEQTIRVFASPELDNEFLNFRHGGTLIGIGAVIENMVIRASAHGLSASVGTLVDAHDSALAEITLTKSTDAPDPLDGAIPLRHTNRTTYKSSPLSERFRTSLGELPAYSGVRYVLREGTDERENLARAGADAEIAILENEVLHRLLFSNVVWTDEEEREKRSGLFVKTLELAPPQELMFSLCRKWGVMRALNAFRFSHIIAGDDAKKYATCGAFVGIEADGLTPEHFINAGRLMERIWLLATAHGYAVHPITATLFFGLKLRSNDAVGLTASTWELMRGASEKIRTTLGTPDSKEVVFLFRVGEAPLARARSGKKPPRLVFE